MQTNGLNQTYQNQGQVYQGQVNRGQTYQGQPYQGQVYQGQVIPRSVLRKPESPDAASRTMAEFRRCPKRCSRSGPRPDATRTNAAGANATRTNARHAVRFGSEALLKAQSTCCVVTRWGREFICVNGRPVYFNNSGMNTNQNQQRAGYGQYDQSGQPSDPNSGAQPQSQVTDESRSRLRKLERPRQ